eukprot:EG_transcript_7666
MLRRLAGLTAALLLLGLLGAYVAAGTTAPPRDAAAPNATAPAGFLGQLTERHACYHVGLGGAWTATLPFWVGGGLARLLWGTATWPVRILWRYLLSHLWWFAWPWLLWALSPVIWVLTSRVVTFIPALLYWVVAGTFTFLGSWVWYLLATPLGFLLRHGATVLAAVWTVLWVTLSWLLAVLPAALSVGLLGASYYLRDRLERRDLVRMWLASGAIAVLWVAYLFGVLATVVAAVGLPAAFYAYRELARHTELTKRHRLLITGGIAVAAVFGTYLLLVLRLVLACPFQFTTGYSYLLPAWLAAVLGNGVAAGAVGVLLTVAGLLLLLVLRYGVLPVVAQAVWLTFCRRMSVLTPPAVMYRTLTPAMPQYSVAMLGLQNCVPAERVERILMVSAPHLQWRYAGLEGHEFLACLPATRKEVDCHLRLTRSWCPSTRCLVCHTCHAGLAGRVPLSPWVKLPRLTPALYERGDVEYLLVCRVRQPTGVPPWWTRYDPGSADAVWVQRHRLLPVYLVCLTPNS